MEVRSVIVFRLEMVESIRITFREIEVSVMCMENGEAASAPLLPFHKTLTVQMIPSKRVNTKKRRFFVTGFRIFSSFMTLIE